MSTKEPPTGSFTSRVRARFEARRQHFRALPPLSKPTASDRVIFFAPHPDDEALAASGYLRCAVEAGAECLVILVTDGDRRGLKELRGQEFRRVMQALGIRENGEIRLDYKNGSFTKEDRAQVKEHFKKYLEDFCPTVVISPHPADFHREHRVVSALLYELYQESPAFTLLEYLIHYPPHYPWPRRFAPSAPLLPPRNLAMKQSWVQFPLTPEQVLYKKDVVELYPSQLKTPILRSLMYSLIRSNELFRIFPAVS